MLRRAVVGHAVSVALLTFSISLADPPKYGKVELYHPPGTGFSITNYINGPDTVSVVSNESVCVVRTPTQFLNKLHLTSSSSGSSDVLSVTVDTEWTQSGGIWCCWTEKKCEATRCSFDPAFPDQGCQEYGAGCEEVEVHCTGPWVNCPAGTTPGGPYIEILRIGSPLP
jgi:hypothetical protein